MQFTHNAPRIHSPQISNTQKVLPIGSDHFAFGHQLEAQNRGYQIKVMSGMLEKDRIDFYFDIQVSVPKGRHDRLFIQLCHALDGNYCLKRLPPLYKLIGATRLSTGGTRTTAAVVSLRVTGVLPNRKYRVLCERENGDVVAISNSILVSKETILFESQCEDYMNAKKTNLIEEVRKESDREMLVEDFPMPGTVQDALNALNTSLDELENDANAAELKASPSSSSVSLDEEKPSLPVRLSFAKVYDGNNGRKNDEEEQVFTRFKSRSLQWEDGSDEDGSSAAAPSSNNIRPKSLRWESVPDLDDAIDTAGTAQ